MIRRRRRSVAVAGALLTIGAVVTAACGVGTTHDVDEINPVELERIALPTTEAGSASTTPHSAVDASTPDTSAPSEPTSTTLVIITTTTTPPVPFEAYFVEGSELIALDVDVRADSGIRRQLDVLESGPSSEQIDNGMRTALPVGIIRGVEIANDEITVRLDDAAFATIEPSDQLLLVGQIVLTLTGEPGFREVSFESNGQPMRVPRPNNIVSDRGEPVTRADYDSMLAS